MNDAPFFIVGESRSGTTLIRMMLDGHPRLAIPDETHFIPYLYHRRARFGNLSLVENRQRLIEAAEYVMEIAYGKDKWAPGLAANAQRLAETAPPTYAGVIDAIFRFATKEKSPQRWGDKTPRYVLHLPFLHQLFPEARFVHIVRDGRDVAASLMPLYFGANTPLAAGRDWAQCVAAGEEFVAAHPQQAITVRYEDMVENPEAQLRRICELLEVEYDPTMLRYNDEKKSKKPKLKHAPEAHKLLDQAPTVSRIGTHKTKLTVRQRQLFEAGAGDMLTKLGYDVEAPGLPPASVEILKDKLQNKLLEKYRKPKITHARLTWWSGMLRVKGWFGK